MALLERIVETLEQGNMVSSIDWTNEELVLVKRFFMLTMKPYMVIANTSEEDFADFDTSAFAEKLGVKPEQVVAVSAQIESELSGLNAEEQAEFLSAIGAMESGLKRIIRSAFSLLGLQCYFTAGKKEVRAWTIRVGDTAPQAAGAIHTDFEKGFIKAEVVAYEDYVQHGGEAGAKENGKMRQEGKAYIMKDGDVVHFKFNV